MSGATTVAERLLRVLIVDNDPEAVRATARLFELQGHDVDSALAGRSALSRVILFKPDVILLDPVMPDISGIEVARTIRRLALPGEPVLAVHAAHLSQADMRECASAGFDHYLEKPADISKIDQLVNLVRATAEHSDQFAKLLGTHDLAVYAFTRVQLEFCHLVLDSMVSEQSKSARQRAIGRLHRIVSLASAWLSRQYRMPEDQYAALQTEIMRLRDRVEPFKKEITPR